jgi:hypothetical protein
MSRSLSAPRSMSPTPPSSAARASSLLDAYVGYDELPFLPSDWPPAWYDSYAITFGGRGGDREVRMRGLKSGKLKVRRHARIGAAPVVHALAPTPRIHVAESGWPDLVEPQRATVGWSMS